MNHNLETVPRLYKQARPGLGLRAFARAAARLQGALPGRADQVRADGGPGRDRRRDPRGDARHARARHRHADDRPVPAADARATCRCCATCIRTRSRCSSAKRTRWASATRRSARWCARRTTPTSRPKSVLGRHAGERLAGSARGDRAVRRRRRVLRPQQPHPAVLLHPAGLAPGLVAEAPEEIRAHRAADRAAGVLREHQPRRAAASTADTSSRGTPARRAGSSAGRRRSCARASSGTPSVPIGPSICGFERARRGRRDLAKEDVARILVEQRAAACPDAPAPLADALHRRALERQLAAVDQHARRSSGTDGRSGRRSRRA